VTLPVSDTTATFAARLLSDASRRRHCSHLIVGHFRTAASHTAALVAPAGGRCVLITGSHSASLATVDCRSLGRRVAPERSRHVILPSSDDIDSASMDFRISGSRVPDVLVLVVVIDVDSRRLDVRGPVDVALPTTSGCSERRVERGVTGVDSGRSAVVGRLVGEGVQGFQVAQLTTGMRQRVRGVSSPEYRNITLMKTSSTNMASTFVQCLRVCRLVSVNVSPWAVSAQNGRNKTDKTR